MYQKPSNSNLKKKIKKIWLVNKYAMPPEYESRLRTIKFAHYLQLMGYEVKIFGSSIMHNMNINLISDESLWIERKYDDLNFVHVKSITYKKTAGISRILSDIFFHYNLKTVMDKMPEKADLIIATTDALISNPILTWANKNNIKYIKEVLDMWPDIFVDMGLVRANSLAMKLLWHQAKQTYTKSDAIVFSLTECFEYMRNKKWDKEHGGTVDMNKVFFINNGVDLNDFNSRKDLFKIKDKDLNSDKKKVIYIGSIRMVNNIGLLIKAAENLSDLTDVEFLIYGDGEDRQNLIDYCIKKGLSNVKFKATWTDPKFVPYILSQGYVNILNYINSDFAKYGISSSKMFQYMASGKPIVCNIDLPQCPITSNNIGIAHHMNTDVEYANAIRQIINLSPEDYQSMCLRAKKTAALYDYKLLTKKMNDVIHWIEQN